VLCVCVCVLQGASKNFVLDYCYGESGDILSDSYAERHDVVNYEAVDEPSHPMIGMLTLTVHRGSDLHNVQLAGKMDPYFTIKVGNEQYRSRTHDGGHANPDWDQSFIINLDGTRYETILHLTVWDKNVLADSVIGRLDIPCAKLTGTRDPVWFDLVDPNAFTKLAGSTATRTDTALHHRPTC
jgi:Ca2+-dependent lipid-binding protein